MKAKPLVSVVMPVYNAEEYIAQAIESILTQVFSDFEFIMINDGSTDHSVEIIKTFKDPRIILVENDKNEGIVYSLNKGLDRARGKYIARMDADDISLPHRLQRQVNFLQVHPEISVVGTGYLPIDECRNPTKPPIYRPEYPAVAKWFLLIGSPLAHPSVMYRKEIIQKIGGYSKDFPHAEDYELWTRLCQVSKICSIHDICLLYRDTGSERISKKYFNQQLKTTNQIRQLAYQRLFGEELSISASECIQGTLEKETNGQIFDTCLLLYKAYKEIKSTGDFSSSEETLELTSITKLTIFQMAGRIKNPVLLSRIMFLLTDFSRKEFIKFLLQAYQNRLNNKFMSIFMKKSNYA